MVSVARPVAVTIGVIFLVTLATGPLGPLSIPEGGLEDPGTGAATVSVESAPASATLTAGDYTDVHYLEAPPVVLSVSDVRASPLLTMSLDLDELGYSHSSTFLLSSGMSGPKSFQISRSSLDSDRIAADTYNGTLRIVLRDDSGKRTVLDRNVTVEVRG
jgi:hypothetical protein